MSDGDLNQTINDGELFVFADDPISTIEAEKVANGTSNLTTTWKILVVDDDEAVHQATSIALEDFTFEDRTLELISAYSGEQAKDLISKHPDTAVILLDVVMQTHNDGLQVIRYIRDELNNKRVRIILRTGQPGEAPEASVILNYDINDYRLKTELTRQKLITAIVASLRSYKNILTIEHKSEELSRSLEQQKEINELKSRFVSTISHEFRTPLMTILSSTELLQLLGNELTLDEQDGYFNRIFATVKYMNDLLEDVLLIGKIEAGKLEFHPSRFNLLDLCQNLLEELKLNHVKHQIAFVYQDNCPDVYLDKKLLGYILNNLLCNAIKYSPENNFVDFQVNYTSTELIFSIRDRGIGIPKTDQEQLFNSFYRASNVGSISGTGLGLAIVKQAVDLHDGLITFKSQEAVGTTFIVKLPLTTQ
jgi:signal transduction histidine kinase